MPTHLTGFAFWRSASAGHHRARRPAHRVRAGPVPCGRSGGRGRGGRLEGRRAGAPAPGPSAATAGPPAWADGIAFLQQLGEGGAHALRDRILHRLGQVGEGGVAVDALQVAQHQVGHALRRGLHRFQRVDHRRKQDRLHDVGRGSLHVHSPVFDAARWTWRATLPNSARVTRQFHKMHGLGNDFVVLDAREQPVTMTSGAGQGAGRPPPRHRLRPADPARAVRHRRRQDAHLEP